MLLRIENSFLQLANKLGKPFSEEDKEKLATSLELNYQNIRSVISTQENSKEQSKPTIIELGNIGGRFFALNIYYSRDEWVMIYPCLLESYCLPNLLFT
jgi:hypothetical protein